MLFRSAAHRKLKVHADEYFDKRTLSTAELLGKFDNLIGLGELTSDGELAIPVEVDEVAIDDEVLVDEVDSAALDLGDAEDFNEGGHTQHSITAFDDLIDAETDAADTADGNSSSGYRHSSRHERGVTLQDCLRQFMQPEVLSREEAWYCPK